jgi:hypothetical protein
MSMMEGVKEFLDIAYEVTALNGASKADFTFNTSILNYDQTNSS